MRGAGAPVQITAVGTLWYLPSCAMPPVLVISLDFELYWGVRDRRSVEAYGSHVSGVRLAVPRMLDLFRRYEVHATWATVGMVLLRDVDDLRAHAPTQRPGYRLGALCPYAYVEREGLRPDLHFAPDLVERVLATPGQELATHTFSHFYCIEEPRSLPAFRADLEAARRVTRERFGVEARSLVFPRNQYTAAHLRVAKELGIEAYRGTPQSWMYAPRATEDESLLRRAVRLLDACAPVAADLTFPLPVADPSAVVPVNVVASRFLRPFSRRSRLLAPLQLRRIRGEMRRAASRGRAYHLWWHPHNFGVHTEENMRVLGVLLDEFAALRQSHAMESRNMIEVAAMAAGSGA